MSMLSNKCLEVFNELMPVSGMAISAAGEHPFLDWLMEIAKQFLPLLLTCLPVAKRNDAGVSEALNSPNLRQRLGLRFLVNKNIDDPRTSNLGSQQIVAAFCKTGVTVTPEHAHSMMAEIAA